MDPHTTVVIPFDDCVILVRLLNGAEFSGRRSEVPQTLDAISGTFPGRTQWARRAMAFWHGPRQESPRGVTRAAGELYAAWV